MTIGAGPAHHGGLAAGGWARLSLIEQLANVGSEVDRAIDAHQRGKQQRWENALARALELFDLTAADARWHGPRLREILRAREEFCRLFFDTEVPAEWSESLKKYFLQFALAAQLQRASQ
jgi:hypothetical protein